MDFLFTDLSDKFLEWAAKCRRPNTVEVYRHYLSKFAAAHTGARVSDITPAAVEAWARTWHDVQSIKRLFAWACGEARLIPTNGLTRVKHPPKGVRKRIITRDEMARMLRTSKRDCRRLLIGYRETMARPEELRIAEWADVLPTDPRSTLRDALAAQAAAIVLYEFKDRGKRRDTETPRVILLSPRACRLLLRLYDRSSSKSGHIFKTNRGRAWTSNALRCRFRVLRRRLGIEPDRRGETIVPYSFRHTGATIAAAAGVRDRVLADVLGHIETKTTSRYVHLQRSHLTEAMAPVWSHVRPAGNGCSHLERKQN